MNKNINKKYIRERLDREFSAAVPDVLPRVKATGILPTARRAPVRAPRRSGLRVAASLAAVAVLVISAVFVYVLRDPAMAVITLDFSENHSVALSVDKDMRVCAAESLSRDSGGILSDGRVGGMKLDEAIKFLLARFSAQENLLGADITAKHVLLLSVDANDSASRSRVQAYLQDESVQESYTFYSSARAYFAEPADAAAREDAGQYGVSAAKYALILRVKDSSGGKDYDIEQLARLTPGRLIDLLGEDEEE